MRKLIALPVALAISLAAAGAVAGAGAPEINRSFLEFPDGVFESCGPFDVVATDASRERIDHIWYDDAGNVLLERARVHFDFTLTNSVTGTSGRYTGQFVVEFDATENLFAMRGAYRKLQIDGQNVLSASGYTLWDDDLLPDETPLFIHGTSSVDEWHEELFDAMNR